MSSRVQQLSRVAIVGALFQSPSIRITPWVWPAVEVVNRSLERLRQIVARRHVWRTGIAAILVPALIIIPTTRAFSVTQSQAPGTTRQAQTQTIDPAHAFALKGINIGNDQSSTSNLPYQAVQNEADLAYLKGKVSRIRIALAYGLDANDVRNLKRLAIAAKQQGFYVQFGITAGADPNVSEYYDQWLSRDIVTTAQWAQANHIDEFAIGNEEDWYCQVLGAFTTKTPTEIRNDVKNEVAAVRQVYSGSIVYADAEGTLDDWIKEGIGKLDRIYFNVYDTLPNFRSIISKIVANFGADHGGITEWSTYHVYTEMIQDGMTPDQYTQELMNRATIVRNSGLPAYLFTLRMDTQGNGWEFVLGDGTKRPGLDVFLAS